MVYMNLSCWFAWNYELVVVTFTYLASYFMFVDFIYLVLIQMTNDYNTRGKKDAGTFEDAWKSNEDNLQKNMILQI